MNRKDLSIATMTLVRNEAEEAALTEALTRLAQLEIPVYLTDGGSPPSFLRFLRGFPQFVLQEPARGLWPQTKSSLTAAYGGGTPYLFYTEPDKALFFERFLPALLEDLQPDGQTGVVLAARSPGGFATFPPFQQMTETTINRCCAEVIGEPTDYVYGPFLLHRELVPFLDRLPPTIGWGWRPYAFHLARRLGYRVEAVTGDFPCPDDQRREDGAERLHRMRQLAQNMEGLTLSASVAVEG
ncbi:hypothetical protein V9K67_08320 [Paraflavisolibacter sp. H34]|uniref:hypothetical protein n=1 Tax=Huijunlia imazamoxiresistens TaxID=3127457 RepID=UPI0030177008